VEDKRKMKEKEQRGNTEVEQNEIGNKVEE
jgi:hypothetical protein